MKLRDICITFRGVYGKLEMSMPFSTDSGYILIDCGRYDALDITAEYGLLNISEHKITHVLLTHAHDHVAVLPGFKTWGTNLCRSGR